MLASSNRPESQSFQVKQIFSQANLKRVAFNHIQVTRFKLLFSAYLYPETGSHFRETCFRA